MKKDKLPFSTVDMLSLDTMIPFKIFYTAFGAEI